MCKAMIIIIIKLKIAKNSGLMNFFFQGENEYFRTKTKQTFFYYNLKSLPSTNMFKLL